MHSASLLTALALLSAVSAVPLKRDVEVHTVTEVEVVYQAVTATVWVDPEAPATTTAAPSTSAAPSPVQVTTTSVPEYKAPPPPPPAPTTTSSVYVAPPPPPAPTTSSTPPPPPPPPAPPAPTTSSTTPPAAPAPAPTTSTSAYQEPAKQETYVPPAAPTTTSTPQAAPAAPATSSVAAAAPASSPASSPASGSTSSGGSTSSSPKGDTHTGDITYYSVGLGSCGETSTDSEMVVAMSAALMNKATMCGKTITLSYQGNTQTATVVDTCPGCSAGSLDLSPALFKAIAPNGDGRVHDVEWWFN